MKKLGKEGIGKFKKISDKEKVYYKPLPCGDNRQLLSSYINFDEFEQNFRARIEQSHTNRITAKTTIINESK